MTSFPRSSAIFIFSALYSLNTFAVSVSFNLETGGDILQPAHLAGTCLPIWNNASSYNQIQKGLAQSNYRLFRFPNGTLSNGYHWNGTGSYTGDSVWTCDSLAFSAGFMSKTLWRGTSVTNWGFESYSNVADGDTNTFWRSDDLIAGSDPYCYLELSSAKTIDSIVVYWGDRYAADFDVDVFTLVNCPYPGPFGYKEDLWENRLAVTGNDQRFFAAAIPDPISTGYVRVRIKKFKESEMCVEVGEVYLFSGGVQVSRNTPAYGTGGTGNQTRVIAMPTFIGSTLRSGYNTTKSWHFESFMAYIESISENAVPLITVNYGTGTPEEAAAWVHYANIVRKYNVKFWQVGNEPDGAWEDGGPLTAAMYAEKFLLFSRAMKAVDPTIKVLGPLFSNAWFADENSGLYDGKPWMRAFIDIIGAAEKTDGRKYCDGIDFHSYPYWDTKITEKGMLASIDELYCRLDSLGKWIGSSLAGPESVHVAMTEFNSSTILSSLLQKSLNGLYVANMFAGFAEKFGGRAMSVFWDSYEDGGEGTDGTFGSLSLFNATPSGMRSSLTKPPSAAYWALYAAQNLWIDPQKENTVVRPVLDSGSIRAYGIKTADDFRVLLFNFSPDSAVVSCSVSGREFGSVDVITWGENQFAWQGTDSKAYAFPNCGPVSRTVPAADGRDLHLPGLTLCVLRYHDGLAAGGVPRLLHVLTPSNTGSALALPLCGTVTANGVAITSIEYALDSTGSFTTGIASLDGEFDGPIESFSDTLDLDGFSVGSHSLRLKVHTASGDSSVDTFTFWVSNAGVEFHPRSMVRPGWRVAEKQSGSRITLTIDPPARYGDGPSVVARIFALNGTCVRTVAGKSAGRTVIDWAGETGINGRAAAGMYYLTVSAGQEVLYRTTMILGR